MGHFDGCFAVPLALGWVKDSGFGLPSVTDCPWERE